MGRLLHFLLPFFLPAFLVIGVLLDIIKLKVNRLTCISSKV